MDVLIPLSLIVLGVPLLTVGADAFVAGAGTTARRFGVSAVVVGAVVLGFGTSLPEAVVSARAAMGGRLDLALGNVLGSNVANLTLVPGLAGLLAVIPVSRRARRVLLPLALAATALLGVLLLDGALTRVDGVVLLVAMAGAMVLLLRGDGEAEDLDALAGSGLVEQLDGAEPSTLRLVSRSVLGIAAVLAGAEVIVRGASDLAAQIGLSEGFVGLTIVAVGTSLPELATSVSAARRGEMELLAGNVLGSNVFNALVVGGLAALLGPGTLATPGLGRLGALVAVLVTLAAALAVRRGTVTRRTAALALVLWIGLLPVLA